jgi:hypothetical protein
MVSLLQLKGRRIPSSTWRVGGAQRRPRVMSRTPKLNSGRARTSHPQNLKSKARLNWRPLLEKGPSRVDSAKSGEKPKTPTTMSDMRPPIWLERLGLIIALRDYALAIWQERVHRAYHCTRRRRTRITCTMLQWSQWPHSVLAGQRSSSGCLYTPLQKISRRYSEDIWRIQTILAALRWRSPHWILYYKVSYGPYPLHFSTAVAGNYYLYPTTLSARQVNPLITVTIWGAHFWF